MMTGEFSAVTHVIMDMDGVLLDTEVLHKKATQNILDNYGKEFSWDVKVTLMGLQRENFSKKIVEIYELPMTWQEYSELVQIQIDLLMEDCQLCPGAERLVRHLHSHNIPICVATSSNEKSVEVKTRKFQDLFKLFNHKVMGSSDLEVKNGKPAPDIFLIAAQRFEEKPEPKMCLVIEDAPNGLEAGCAAGMQVVMIPDPHVPEEQTKGANLVLKSLEDFQPELFGLPPFTN
ncbi:unnamed protein product [Diamesa tonsa]